MLKAYLKPEPTTPYTKQQLAMAFNNKKKAMAVSPVQWEAGIAKFIKENRKDARPSELSIIRHNLNHELSKPAMSWAVFCKGSTILGVDPHAVLKESVTT
jgi:hypothetical protein